MLMRRTCKNILFLVLSFAAYNTAHAIGKGNSLISLSAGIITVDEFKGVTYSSYMGIPFGYTGSLFCSYWYFITDNVVVGLSAGIDQVTGHLTYGNPHSANTVGYAGITGTYVRHTATIALPELLFKYSESKAVMLYGYGGVAYTFSTLEKAYDPMLYANAYVNGTKPPGFPYYLSAENPVYTSESHWNAHFTAIGIRTKGRVEVFGEFGFGYKGLINAGLSLKL